MRGKRYLLCTKHAWGEDVFMRIGRPYEIWDLCRGQFGASLEMSAAVLDPHYIFFVHWSPRVPRAILDRWVCVNLHGTPLPYGRGGHPIENMILRGHATTMMTAHRMTEEIDAGPIYGRDGPIDLSGTKDMILQRFIDPCARLIRLIVEQSPAPIDQVGEIVQFERLDDEAYRRVWEERIARQQSDS